MSDLHQYAEEMHRLAGLLDSGLTALRTAGTELAQAEHDYRLAKAQAFATAPAGTVPEREAHVNSVCAPQRQARDLAEYLRVAALEAVRSRRTQLSALQTLLNAHKAEADMVTYGGSAAA